jgi:5-(carboxyamino)imidazole ribonucleotide synthase
VLEIDGAHLHDYGKPGRPGRKVGHVTVTAADPSALEERLTRVHAAVGAAAR